MRYIKQKDKYGCAIACLAMVTGVSYDEILSMFPKGLPDRGISTEFQGRSILFEHGFLSMTFYKTISHTQEENKEFGKPIAPIHIISVITNADTSHAVVMDDKGNIYDPFIEGVYKLSNYKKLVSITGVWNKK